MSTQSLTAFFERVVDGDIDGAIKLTTDEESSKCKDHQAFPSTANVIAMDIRATRGNDQIVFGYGTMQHHVKRTGRRYQSEWALYCILSDGKISHYRIFEDKAALVAAYIKY